MSVVAMLCSHCFSDDDLCREWAECDSCLQDPKCGWCDDYSECNVGNQTGPIEGSCDWYYYYCPLTSSTSTMSPSHNYNLSWITYGGDNKHSGFVNYTNKIDDKTHYINAFTISAIGQEQQYQYSPVATLNDMIYFAQFNGSYTCLNGYSIEEEEILWQASFNEYTNVDLSYCSGPSISSNNKYIVCMMGQTYTITGFVIEVTTGDVVGYTGMLKFNTAKYITLRTF